MFKKAHLIAIIAILLVLPLSGCGNGSRVSVADSKDSNPGSQATNNEPIKLGIYQNGLAITDEDFENFFVTPVKNKFPNITLELVRTGDGTTPQELVAAGTLPDIIFASVPVFKELNKLKILTDLNDLVKKNKVDLAKFDPLTVDAIKMYGDKGELYALPFSRAFGALFYNKDIFDKFGVAYPKDGMDWDQAAELARKVSRVDNGTQYRGFEPGNMRVLGQALSLQFIDPKTERATLNNEDWKRVLKEIQDIYNIPNNLPPKAEFNKTRPNFIQRKNVAMITDWANGISGELEGALQKGQGLNWDLVTHPNFKEKVGTGRNVDVQCLLLSTTTKHPEQAFAVINYLTSEEPQLIINKAGRPAAINSPEMEKTYAANLESFKGKNIAGIFKYKSAKPNIPTDYDQQVYAIMNEATTRVGLNNEDVNTVLREIEEKANAVISEEKSK